MHSVSVILAIGFLILLYAGFVSYRKSSYRKGTHPASAEPVHHTQYDKYFHHLFDETAIAYHDIDRNGIIQRVNRAECDLLGYGPEQLVGRPVWELVAPGAK